MADKVKQDMETIEKRSLDLRQIFEGAMAQKSKTYSRQAESRAVGESIDNVMKGYAVLTGKIKEYIATAVKAGKSSGVKLKAVEKPNLGDKVLALVNKNWADSRMLRRLKDQTISQDMNVMQDNIELYAQAEDLMISDLEKSKEELAESEKEDLKTKRESQELIAKYKPLLAEYTLTIEDKIKQRDALEDGVAATDLEFEINDLKAKHKTMKGEMEEAAFQIKCADENYAYSQTMEEVADGLIDVLKSQRIVLQRIAISAAKNMQVAAKTLMGVKQGAGAVAIYDAYRKTMNELASYAGRGVEALAAETKRMLTEEIYDKNVLATASKQARNAARIIDEAAISIIEQYSAETEKQKESKQ